MRLFLSKGGFGKSVRVLQTAAGAVAAAAACGAAESAEKHRSPASGGYLILAGCDGLSSAALRWLSPSRLGLPRMIGAL